MRSMPGACELSVLIATRDRAASLARTLDSLVVQVWPGADWELLVVHDGPDLETVRHMAGDLVELDELLCWNCPLP